MRGQKSIYHMTDRELRTYKRLQRRQREFKRKCFTVMLTFCLVILCAVSYHAIQTNASTGEDNVHFKYYTDIIVSKGETLWDIAEKYIDYSVYKNKNDYIAEVQSINHLQNKDAIRTGQHLIVPYYSEEFIN